METNTKPELQITHVTDESLSLILKAEIDMQISTAKAFPRSLKMFMDRAMSMATLNEDIAESCSYAVPRAGEVIEGKSVRLAEIICASYGNIRSGARVIANDGKSVTAQGFCHDLETNNYIAVEVKKRITNKKGQTYSEDMQIVTGNAACAVAFRNAVFKVIPSALSDGIYEEAKKVAKGTAATLTIRATKAVEIFKTMGVTEKQICDVLELKKIEDIDLDKLATLTAYKSAIKNGESTVKDIFSKEEISIEDLQLLFDLKKDSLSEIELKDANRILSKKEVNSYSKLNELLKSK